MLFSGQLDISPSSSIEYAKSPQKYLILNNLSISSIGPVKSVFLFSRLPIEKLNMQTVGLTKESDTSVNLLKIILHKFYEFRNAFETTRTPTLDALDDFPAILLIGDSALKEDLHRVKGIYAYDLGELWYRYTRLPFVFALWIVREETVLTKGSKVLTLYTQLREAKDSVCNSFESFAEGFGKEWIGKEELITYWKTISYDLTHWHLEGLRVFYRFSAELGLIDGEPQLRLFP